MNNLLLEQLQAAQQQLAPQFKALKVATGALQTAVKTANTDKPEALAMQKALVKLQQAADLVDDETLKTAVATFAQTLFPTASITLQPDFAGYERFVIVEKS